MSKKNNKQEEYIKNLPDVRASLGDDDDDEKSFSAKKPDSKSKTPVLDTYSRDLTKMAEEGKLDAIVGRDKEIERVSQILSRRKKNNSILLGEPGCVVNETLITVKKTSNESNHNLKVV